MGCTNSSEQKELKGSIASFDHLVYSVKHPVAIKLKEEWTLFANAYQSAGNHLSESQRAEALRRLETQPQEVWANTASNAVTHSSVDEVGKCFLLYLRAQLVILGWGGNFDYKVVGIATQGFIAANAEVDVTDNDNESPVIRYWNKKIHYYSLPRDGKQ